MAASVMDHASQFGLMTCAECREPVVLTVEQGYCPRCYYRLECEAICAAAEGQVDRVFDDSIFAEGADGAEYGERDSAPPDWDAPTMPAIPAQPATARDSSEPAWSW